MILAKSTKDGSLECNNVELAAYMGKATNRVQEYFPEGYDKISKDVRIRMYFHRDGEWEIELLSDWLQFAKLPSTKD